MKFSSLALSLTLAFCVHTALAADTAVSTYTEESSLVSIKATWQRSGLHRPDNDSDTLVRDAVSSFRATAAQEQKELRKLRAEEPDIPVHPSEMILEGTLSDNGKVTGMLWKDYQYLGGAHGNLAVFSRNYTSSDGRPVGLNDLFRKPGKAVQLFSELTRKELAKRDLPQDMVKDGTAPEAENFQTFLLEKDGITLYFSPYQVAPWSEGVVSVTLTLRELAAAEPYTAYWK